MNRHLYNTLLVGIGLVVCVSIFEVGALFMSFTPSIGQPISIFELCNRAAAGVVGFIMAALSPLPGVYLVSDRWRKT